MDNQGIDRTTIPFRDLFTNTNRVIKTLSKINNKEADNKLKDQVKRYKKINKVVTHQFLPCLDVQTGRILH